MLIKLLHHLKIVEAIWLLDVTDGCYLTFISKKTPFGNFSYIYPFTKVGQIRLEDDGTVKNSYIKKWKYYDPRNILSSNAS